MEQAIVADRIGRVVNFIEGQLSDTDIAMVYGDSDGTVHFYSTKPFDGYRKIGDVYVRDVGTPNQWDADALEDLK